MAVFKQSSGGGGLNLGTPPPPGTHVAVCCKVMDQFGVDPASIGWQTEAEKGVKQVDVTRFIFGVLGPDGKTYYVGTRLLRISGNEKSALYKLLTAWLGKPPQYGRDYAAEQQADPEMGCMHRAGMISVVHTARGDRTYADVAAIMPLPPGLPIPRVADWVPQAAAADAYYNQAGRQAPPAAQAQQQQPPPQQTQQPPPAAAAGNGWGAPAGGQPAQGAPAVPGGGWNVNTPPAQTGADKSPF